MTVAGKQDLSAPENNFFSFFYAFDIKEGKNKEDYMKIGESNVWTGFQDC